MRVLVSELLSQTIDSKRLFSNKVVWEIGRDTATVLSIEYKEIIIRGYRSIIERIIWYVNMMKAFSVDNW